MHSSVASERELWKAVTARSAVACPDNFTQKTDVVMCVSWKFQQHIVQTVFNYMLQELYTPVVST
jgi:hypothetical protein